VGYVAFWRSTGSGSWALPRRSGSSRWTVSDGRSLFALANREINLRIAEVYRSLPPPALSRFGEVLSRTDEVV
jgi:hypothetical protein